jgi:hypothetical protein
MKVRDLLAALNDLTIGDLEKEVYVDVEGDEYVELELIPIAETHDSETIGFVICQAKPVVEVKEEVH